MMIAVDTLDRIVSRVTLCTRRLFTLAYVKSKRLFVLFSHQKLFQIQQWNEPLFNQQNIISKEKHTCAFKIPQRRFNRRALLPSSTGGSDLWSLWFFPHWQLPVSICITAESPSKVKDQFEMLPSQNSTFFPMKWVSYRTHPKAKLGMFKVTLSYTSENQKPSWV